MASRTARSETPVPPTGPDFLGTGGVQLRRSTRALEAHLVRQWCVCPSQAAPLTPEGAQGGWRRRRPARLGRLHSVPLNISCCNFRSVSVPPGKTRVSSRWWGLRCSYSHARHLSQNGGMGCAHISLATL